MLALLAALAATPDLHWLSGYWLSCEGGREVSETWSDPRAGTMTNTTLTLSKGKLTVEIADIRTTAGAVVFHAQPPGQQAADFPVKAVTATSVVFENPTHDFPQRVIYRREGDTLHARVEGVMAGKAGEEWTYRTRPLNSRCP